MSEFEKCVKRGGLRTFSDAGQDAIDNELRAAREDLADAEFRSTRRPRRASSFREE